MAAQGAGRPQKGKVAAGSKAETDPFAAFAAVMNDDDTSILAGMSPLDGDEDAGDFCELQKALERVIKSKSQKSNQKQSAIIIELQHAVIENIKALEAVSAKDAKELDVMSTKKFDNISKQMQEKFEQIEQLNQKYQQDLHAKWDEYQELYGQLETAKSDMMTAVSKKRATMKKKIDQAQADAAERLQAAQGRISKCKSQASKLPGLAKMLKAFL